MSSAFDHHIKDDFCLTRPPYRNGKKLRAVKVYTIAQESKYLLVQNVPSIVGAAEQLLAYFARYGQVEQCSKLDNYVPKDSVEDSHQFVDAFLIKYLRIERARLAKCCLDDLNFLGSILHICYAPEYENLDDLREKFQERRTIVERKAKMKQNKRIHSNNKVNQTSKINSLEQTTNEIRSKIRSTVQKSNLVSLALQQDVKRKKRINI